MHDNGEVTRLLQGAADGDRAALDRLAPIVYEELRRVAHRRMAAEATGHTLSTTALVHEAWIELAGLERIQWRGRAQFFAIAARAMRRILVDYAVARKAKKRGGDRRPVSLEALESFRVAAEEHAPSAERERGLVAAASPADGGDNMLVADGAAEDLLALNEALGRLAGLDERQSRVLECRFFGGMTWDETAAALAISPATAKRDWTAARAWLNRELS